MQLEQGKVKPDGIVTMHIAPVVCVKRVTFEDGIIPDVLRHLQATKDTNIRFTVKKRKTMTLGSPSILDLPSTRAILTRLGLDCSSESTPTSPSAQSEEIQLIIQDLDGCTPSAGLLHMSNTQQVQDTRKQSQNVNINEDDALLFDD
jgi:hypothetical protein